ncbi:hypothetical protein ACFQQB_30720 [Nonomuraea rubra]|uniref:hypothetical protein n=1 Tax=Nonomuraea rubra TaxID=46180 RepID=UPI0036243752
MRTRVPSHRKLARFPSPAPNASLTPASPGDQLSSQRSPSVTARSASGSWAARRRSAP